MGSRLFSLAIYAEKLQASPKVRIFKELYRVYPRTGAINHPLQIRIFWEGVTFVLYREGGANFICRVVQIAFQKRTSR